ncbi:FIST N-terminal domain-containing protein [Gallaecimonas pentaromativorans]|uniref:FIST-like protein n=1 Tax=Gallaecimonas pentaromativorans TaxID=584787 RepID=A0A3N1PQI6_9GAMM|nr:FIST N-terminal domain-containing protein [Gallaecimonas pentaromativorans]ROQ30469.1 hypothetical protein EDC28_101155 [Gallaecimonas pentaromativorans]
MAPDSRQAAAQLVRRQPNVQGARWGLLFASGFHEAQGLFSDVQRRLGSLPLIGGSCCGIITPSGVEYGGFEAMLLLFDSEPQFNVFKQSELGQVADWQGEDFALCFFDHLAGWPATALEPLRHCTLMGASLLGDFNRQSSFLFCGDRVANDCLVAVKIPQPTQSAVSHGSVPISEPLTVTQADGQWVQRLDDKPALEVISQITGLDEAELRGAFLRHLSLGQPWQEHFSSHLIAEANAEDKSLRMATGYFPPGQQAVLMSRSADSTFVDVEQQLGGFIPNKPSFYINCAGRTGAFSGALQEEADLVRQYLGKDVVGIFSGAELASQGGESRLINWSGVLLQW